MFRLQGFLCRPPDRKASTLQVSDRGGNGWQSISRDFPWSNLATQAVQLAERSLDHERTEQTAAWLEQRRQARKQPVQRLHPLERRAAADQIVFDPGADNSRHHKRASGPFRRQRPPVGPARSCWPICRWHRDRASGNCSIRLFVRNPVPQPSSRMHPGTSEPLRKCISFPAIVRCSSARVS